MLIGAKVELLLKTGALYLNSLCKKGGAASEQLQSDSGAAPEQREAGRSKVEQKKLIKKMSKTKTNSETHFQHNNIIIEFSLITATFWIPHTSFYVQD